MDDGERAAGTRSGKTGDERERTDAARERALALLRKHYADNPVAYAALVAHGDAIMGKIRAILARKRLAVNTGLLTLGAYLHDIGLKQSDSPRLGCHGEAYIRHGILGRAILEAEGLPDVAMMCERHIGVGLVKEEIERQRLPLPARDMIPTTDEEELLAFADLFFSKKPGEYAREKTKEEIRRHLLTLSERHAKVFDELCERYEE